MANALNMKLTCMVLLFVLAGCAGRAERDAFRDWSLTDERWYDGSQEKTFRGRDSGPSEQTREAKGLPADATFDDYVRYAIRENPQLKAAFYRWRAALERVPQARSLPDPTVSFGLIVDQVDRSGEYMGERYSINQMFPWFGTLEKRGDVALEAASAEAEQFEATRLEVVDRVSRAYFEYAYLHRAISVLRENIELMKRLESMAQTMYRNDLVSMSDVNRAQVELGKLDEQLMSMQDMVGPAAAALNAALGRSSRASLPDPAPISLVHDVAALPNFSDEQWLTLAGAHNPELAALRHRATEQRRGIALAEQAYYPDFGLGVEYGRGVVGRMAAMDGGGEDMVMGMVSVTLPIWREKYDAGVREALANFGQATHEIQSRQNSLEAELKKALFNYRDSIRKMDLYGGTLLPKAKQTLQSVESAYRANETDFSAVIDSQRVLLEFQLALDRAAADRAMTTTRIQTLVGQIPDDPEPIDAMSDLSDEGSVR